MAVKRVSARNSGGPVSIDIVDEGQWNSQMDVQTRKRIGEDGLAGEGKRRKSVSLRLGCQCLDAYKVDQC